MKIRIAGLIILSFFLFTGATPWEGAAATAPEGELPAKGRYVATNSFPRNTVVDIINIETNRSTRAIVAGGLESPGLLALVSKEAAELIGMRTGSVSRIRMTQPSEPIAYLRFRDGVASGTPDYDSGNVITEERYREAEWTREDAERASSASIKGAPPYYLEPEWISDGRRSIVNLPVSAEEAEWMGEETPKEVAEVPPEGSFEEAEWLREEIPEELVEEIPEEVEEELVEEFPEEVEEELVEEFPEEIEEELVEEIPEEVEEELVEELPEEVEEELVEEIPPEIEEELAEELPPEVEEETPVITEYELVEAEENPPPSDVYFDPESIIPGIAMPEDEPVYSPEPSFSAQRIYDLERGRYYVQIAAHDAPELVESEISETVLKYDPVVYKDGDRWYRVLLGGPKGLNQGESAAVLQRFKSIGYKDAFVRLAK